MTDRAQTAAPPPARRIVVVDDEADLRAMLEDYLSLHGFAVRGAADAAAAGNPRFQVPDASADPPGLLAGECGLPLRSSRYGRAIRPRY